MGDVIEILTTATNTVEVEAQGPQGIPGVGVPTGGSALQVLRKKTSTDYDTEWAAAGSGSGSVTSVALASTDLTISGSPITESGTITANIAVNAVTLEKLQTISSEHLLGRHGSGNGGVQQIGLGTGLAMSGSNVGVTFGSSAGTACQGNDARLSDARTPSSTLAHAASHASSGSDPLAPSDIGAQSIFTSETITLSGDTTLSAARAKIWTVNSFSTNTRTITLPTSAVSGDVAIVRAQTILGNVEIVSGSTLATMQTGAIQQNYRFVYTSSWALDPVTTHGHFASQIVSGTLAHERGGLEADVSAYNGLVKISGGSTSAVTVTSAGEALLDDADAAAQRTTLGLGTAATAATGDFAAASHSHELTALAATGATNGHVLTANGSNGATFAALPASGVSSVSSSASDVLGVSGANITGVDANADRIVYWNNTSNKLAYGTPADAGAAAASHTHAANDVTSGTFDNARINFAAPAAIGNTTPNTGAFTSLSTAPAANTSALTTTGYSLTGSNAQSLVDLAGTWNTTGTPSAIKLNITNTASNASSLLMQLQTGGTNRFTVNRDGDITCAKIASGGTASGFQASVLGGRSNSASSDRSIAAGDGCTSSGINTIAMGASNTASASQGFAIGLQSRADRLSMLSHASGIFAAVGDAQRFRAVLRCKTTTNAAVEMALDGGTLYLTIPSGKVIFCNIKVVGVKSDGSVVATYERQYAAKNVAGTSSEVFAPVTIGTDNASSTSLEVATVDAGDYIRIRPTGITAETWRWVASVDAVEVAYGT